MPIRRRYDERPLIEAGPRFTKLFLMAVGSAVLLGAVIGTLWTLAGLVRFAAWP